MTSARRRLEPKMVQNGKGKCGVIRILHFLTQIYHALMASLALPLALSLSLYIYIYILRIELTTKILKKFIALIEEGNKSIKLNTSIEKSNYTTTFFFLSKCGGLNLQIIGLYTARVPTCLHEVVVITLLAIKNTNCKTFTTHKRGAIQLNPSLSIIYLYIKVFFFF